MSAKTDIAILTNAEGSGQRSMIGYGRLLIEAARRTGAVVAEFQGTSVLSGRLPERAGRGRLGKVARDIERFILSPAAMAGRHADIVHVADPGNVVYLGAIRRRVSVVTVHDMIPYLCLAGRLKGFTPSRLGRLLMRGIVARLRRMDRIVCVSQATRRDLLEIAGVDPAGVTVIENAVFQPIEPARRADCDAFRARLGIPREARVVMHIGGAFYKNRDAVLETFLKLRRRMPNAFLVFVSAPGGELGEAIVRAGADSYVRFVPYFLPSDLAVLYTTADLLLFPSLYEGFGYPVLEAQLCGTPVICSDAGSLPEVAGDGARLFDAHDTVGMAVAAEELLSDDRAAESLVARGRENAKRFTESGWLAAHRSLYGELLSGAGNR